MRRLAALWILGVALVATLLRRLIRLGRSGLESFHHSYDRCGLSRLDPDERAVVDSAAGCVACGLCDRGEGARRAASAGEYPGMMALVLAVSRSAAELATSASGFRPPSDQELAEKEALCPSSVPIRRVARLVLRHGADARVDGRPSGP